MATFKETSSNSKRKNHYDIIIWGSSLAGLILANQAQNLGLKCLLIEEKDALGDTLSPVETSKGCLEPDLSFIPDLDSAKDLVRWLGEFLGEDLVLGRVNSEPKTFSEGQLKSFVGFGDKNFLSSEELNYYNASYQLDLRKFPSDWVKMLASSYTGEVLYRSEVTDIIVENKNIVEVIINGAKSYTADSYIGCTSPKDFISKFAPYDSVTPKVRQRVSKAHFWTLVLLHYTHNSIISEDTHLRFLMGNKTDFEPVVGRFFTPSFVESTVEPNPETEAASSEVETEADSTYETSEADTDFESERAEESSKTNNCADEGSVQQQSVWMSLVPSEAAEDDDFVGGVVRNMKKQIKRAHPEVLENPANEKLTVHSNGLGQLNLDLKSVGALPKIENFTLVHGSIANNFNILGQIEVAKEVISNQLSPKKEETANHIDPTIENNSQEAGL